MCMSIQDMWYYHFVAITAGDIGHEQTMTEVLIAKLMRADQDINTGNHE